MGFGVPIDSWLRGPLRDWAEGLLDEGRLRREGFLRPEPIRRFWHEHLSGRRNWQYPLWNALVSRHGTKPRDASWRRETARPGLLLSVEDDRPSRRFSLPVGRAVTRGAVDLAQAAAGLAARSTDTKGRRGMVRRSTDDRQQGLTRADAGS